MSFNIYVSGLLGAASSGGGRKPFKYCKDGCFEQSDFDPPALIAMLPSDLKAKEIAEKIGGTQEEYLANSVINGMSKIAEIELASMVRYGIERLAMLGNGGEIIVYCVQEDWLWGTTNSYANFKFHSGYDQGRDFLKKINPGLVKTGLNNFGVLKQIATALSLYNSSLPGSASPYLNISLSH
jgi:hypothetical protein